jgi:hypothetical protein
MMLALLKTEAIKLNRGRAARLILLLPLGFVALHLTAILHCLAEERSLQVVPTTGYFTPMSSLVDYLVSFFLMNFSALAIPMILTQYEHRQDTWAYLYSLPIRKEQVLHAKALMAMLILGAELLVLLVLQAAEWQVVYLKCPIVRSAFPLGTALAGILLLWLGSAPLVAFNTLISLRWSRAIVSVLILVLGLFGSLVVLTTQRDSALVQGLPWLMPREAVGILASPAFDPTPLRAALRLALLAPLLTAVLLGLGRLPAFRGRKG